MNFFKRSPRNDPGVFVLGNRCDTIGYVLTIYLTNATAISYFSSNSCVHPKMPKNANRGELMNRNENSKDMPKSEIYDHGKSLEQQSFRCDILSKRFILETLPPRSTTSEKYIEFCGDAVKSGAQVIAITDLPMGSSRTSPIAPAHMLVERGIDVLMHFSRTTRNAIRIEGDLIASHMLGIRNILILSGDDPRNGTYPFSSSVEDFTIYDVFKLAKLLNEKNEDLAGVKVYGKFNFCPGGVFSTHEGDYRQTLERMNGKLANGCRFFISQPVFSQQEILDFLEKAEDIRNESNIYVAIMLFETRSQLEYFSKVPGVFVPKEYFRYESDEALKQFSLKRAILMVEKLARYVDGFYLTSTTKDLETIKAISDVVLDSYQN